MKRIDLIKNDKNISNTPKKSQCPNFIGSWNIENDNLCKEIIDLFNTNKNLQNKGVTSSVVDTTIKKTTDISINISKIISRNYIIVILITKINGHL